MKQRYHRCGFLSACTYCKISKKVCAYILDVLKYLDKIDHTHVYGWVKIINDTLLAHGVMIEKAHYKRWPGRRQEVLFDTDKLRIIQYMQM